VALVDARVLLVVVFLMAVVGEDVVGRGAVARCVVVRDTVCGAGLRDTVARWTLSLERVVTLRVVVAPELRVAFDVALLRDVLVRVCERGCAWVTTAVPLLRMLVFVVARLAASATPMHKKHTAKKGSILLILTFC